MSAASPSGLFAVGSDGADLRGNHYYVAMTSVPPDLPPFPSTTQSGYLLRSAMAVTSRFANITAHEVRVNPDGKQVESNPYAVLALAGSTRVLVADAAANAVLSVDSAGRVSTFRAWPPVAGKPEFVPTSLAQDSQGFVYVGGLGSEAPGAAQVVKMTTSGRVVKTFTGFTGITGVAVDEKGFLYVCELFAGKVTKIGGTRRWTQDVPFPSGLAVDAAQNVYVAAFSVADRDGAPAVDAPGTEDDQPAMPGGQVWKLRF
jgi:sugar lactone lactonase YvrE